MRDVLEIVLASKGRLAFALSLTALVVVGGITFGSWAIGSSAGNGYAKAVTAQTLTLGDASASTVAQLYPGGTGDVQVKVTNPNPFAVTATGVSGAGSVTSDKGAACNASTGVTFANATGLSQPVAAGATVTFAVPGAAAMDNTSDSSCQGAIFTIPVTLTATS